jgi:hypothetical protein
VAAVNCGAFGSVIHHAASQQNIMDQTPMPHITPNQSATSDVLSTAGRNSSQTGELALAAAEVVFRRMTLGGFAMVDPVSADHAEFARMVPEKAKAFSAAGSILAHQSAQIGQAMARFMVDEASLAAKAAASLLTSPNPGGMIAAQAEAALAWDGGISDH